MARLPTDDEVSAAVIAVPLALVIWALVVDQVFGWFRK
jgi:hypothetical protein